MSMTEEDVAEAVRGWCTAWHTQDIPTIVAMEARAVGFGFRPLAWRDHIARSEDDYAQVLKRLFGQMEYYALQPGDFQTSVTGEIGLAWGVYREQWQEKGRPPEQARVRFSKVLTKGARGWQVLLYHRDIQPFTDDGRYPRALTVVPPTHEEGVTSRHHFPYMKRLTMFAVTTMLWLWLGGGLFAGDAVTQQPSLHEQLVGTWTLVSADSVQPDGRTREVFGPQPKGVVIYTSDGHFALVLTRADLPKLASSRLDQGTPEENKAVVQGSIAYFGTYAVNEADKVITLQLEGSTFANLMGGADQKRMITSLTADELKFTNPATPAGATLQLVWKRAK